MKNIGFSDQEIHEVIDIVVGILNLGNIEFENLTKSASGDQA
jgi:myosin heavy subunit